MNGSDRKSQKRKTTKKRAYEETITFDVGHKWILRLKEA